MAQIAESITDPDAQIAQGFPPGVMPQNYEQTLTPEQLQQLVDYLIGAVGGSPGAGAPGSGKGTPSG
jgi:cytochrome c oxidase subunit 2